MPSHVIRNYAYDPETRALTVTFVSGRRYRYEDVPEALAEEMRLAFAKGVFFNRRIRGHYAGVELESDASGGSPPPATDDS
jgi:hypothetical protein